ncbi:MAG: hypothetical protein AVDCRST_MAG26-3218, partial [uncultured Chloroflexia bacterium]
EDALAPAACAEVVRLHRPRRQAAALHPRSMDGARLLQPRSRFKRARL